MGICFALLLPFLLANGAVEDESAASGCSANEIDVMFLFEASGSGGYVWAKYIDKVASLVTKLNSHYTNPPNYSVATYVDKPSVHVGAGFYGGWPELWGLDWCYDLAVPMTSSEAILDELKKFVANQRSGFGLDLEQAHLEAIIRGATDRNVGWKYETAQKGYTKVIVLFAATLPHTPDWAGHGLADYVNAFNSPITCDGENRTHGGFGASEPVLKQLTFWTPYEQQYAEYTPIVEKLLCRNGSLTRDELITYRERKGLFWPESVPEVKPFNLTFLMENPEEHCRYHEYPQYSDVNETILQQGLHLVVPIIEWENEPGFDDAVNGWTWIATQFPQGAMKCQAINVADRDHFDELVVKSFTDLIPNEVCDE